ncbi:MAG: hypothetical protein Q7S74_01600 [Nanoarchaeota archaeon]|nr:hypothetical protein [Nanoarchaeota archaeon]
MEGYNDLTPQQMAAIRRGIILGRTLQDDHPEIPQLYREGHSLKRIERDIGISSEYKVTELIAIAGIQKTIAGHNGGFGIESYEGSIPDDERQEIGKEHCVEASRRMYKEGKGAFSRTAEQMIEDGRKGGKKAYEGGMGIHALTLEEKSELGCKGGKKVYEERKGIHALTSEEHGSHGRKGGKVSGRRTYEERKGIHAQTLEEKSELGRKSAIARGEIPWTDEEIEFAYQLSLQPDYHRGKLIRNGLIAIELNKKFHNGEEIRNMDTTYGRLYKHKKSLFKREVE